MGMQRISYVDPETITDPKMREELERSRLEGTPRPESQAIRAHVPAVFWSFANAWRDTFRNGVLDHSIKELCRVYVSQSVKCEYCGNQRSMKSARAGLVEEDYLDLMNFESSKRYGPRERTALAFTEAIIWGLETDDSLWERLDAYFSEPELVELGFFVGLTMGQQRWLKTLNIEHHQILPGTSASMAPGTETPEALAKTKASPEYWGKRSR